MTFMQHAFYSGQDSKAGPRFKLTPVNIERRIASRMQRSHTHTTDSLESRSGSEVVDLSDLLKISDDDEFLRMAYRRILRRECDLPGFINYRELLRRNVSRNKILRALATSPEASQLGVRYIGLPITLESVREAPSRLRRVLLHVASRFVNRLRLIHELIWLRPVELVGAKVDHLFQEIQVRSEQLSVKLDGLWENQKEISRRLSEIQECLPMRLGPLEQARPSVFVVRDGPYVVNVDGLLMAIPSNLWHQAAQMALRGFNDIGVLKLFRKLVRPGMVVVDVGAYLGQFTLEAARLLKGNGKVYSFEPNPHCFIWLRENIILNQLNWNEVIEVRQCALAEKNGRAFLQHCSDTLEPRVILAESGGESSVLVETMTLDEALRNEPHVDVVRIDVDGAEGFVVKGMERVITSNSSIAILMRFRPDLLLKVGTAPDEVLSRLTNKGLSIFVVDSDTGSFSAASPGCVCTEKSCTLLLTRAASLEGFQHEA